MATLCCSMLKYKTDLLLATKVLIATVISILLTFWWLVPMGLYYVIYATAAISLMQAGKGKRLELLSMLFASAAYLVLYLLGVYLRPYLFLASFMLIPLAFIAYYLPNLGLNYRLPPIMGVIIYLVVLMMPVTPIDPLGTSVGMALGCLTAILVYFFLWHYDAEDELLLLMLEITEQYRSALKSIKLWLKTPKRDYLDDVSDAIYFCEQHVATFEQIKTHPEVLKDKSNFFDATQDALYGISKGLRMCVDILPGLTTAERQEFLPILNDVSRTLQLHEVQLSTVFENSFFTRRLIRKSLGLSREVFMTLLRRQAIKINPSSLADFETALLKIVKPEIDAKEAPINPAKLQFAFGLLRIKELYSNLGIPRIIPDQGL